MKRIVSILMCVMLMLVFASCGNSAEPSPESTKMAYAEFCADLEKQEIVAANARIILLDDGKKALATDIKNNTSNGEAISEVVVVFAAWDVEGNPVAIQTEENPSNTSNFMKATVDAVTVAAGETWTANKGLFLSGDCKYIAYVTAIAYSCKIGEAVWENPLYDAWQETYCDLTLESWKMEGMVNYLDGDTSAEEAPTEIPTFAEFYESLLSQDIIAVKATANLQDDGRNALMTNIQNAAQAQATDIVIAFVMWDAEGKPLMIKSASGQSEDSYVKEVGMGALAIDGQTTWEADMGLVIANERKSISHVEAIVVSCKFGDSRWNNPVYDIWCTYFSGCQLDDTMMSAFADLTK